MRYLLGLCLLLLLFSCGNKPNNPNPIGKRGFDNYVPVARAYISIGKDPSIAQKVLDALNPISSAYAATQNVSIVYTAAESATLTLNTAGVVPTLSGDTNTLDLGIIIATTVRTNKLKICGAGGNEKCTSAIIRAYTADVIGSEGIAGFVNTTDGYGVPAFIGPVTASDLLGLGLSSPVVLDEYVIPSNVNKLTESLFTDLDYVASVDFSNAGSGDYEMTLVIELALGN